MLFSQCLAHSFHYKKLSAVFSIFEAIGEAIGAIIEAIPEAISAIGEGIGALAEALGLIGSGLAALPEVLEGATQAIPGQLMVYVLWSAVQVTLAAFYPGYILLISLGFFLFTLYGLWQGFEDFLGAPTLVAALVAFLILAFNVYLVLAVG
jgi:hypothetical protein